MSIPLRCARGDFSSVNYSLDTRSAITYTIFNSLNDLTLENVIEKRPLLDGVDHYECDTYVVILKSGSVTFSHNIRSQDRVLSSSRSYKRDMEIGIRCKEYEKTL